MTLFAIPFGTDGTEGDSSWHPNTLPATDQDTFATLKAKLEAATKDENSEFSILAPYDDGTPDPMSELAGFWLIDSKTKRAIDKVGNSTNPGCDSALYRHIGMLKTMAQDMAIRTLKAA